jgi:hypothetical protein
VGSRLDDLCTNKANSWQTHLKGKYIVEKDLWRSEGTNGLGRTKPIGGRSARDLSLVGSAKQSQFGGSAGRNQGAGCTNKPNLDGLAVGESPRSVWSDSLLSPGVVGR